MKFEFPKIKQEEKLTALADNLNFSPKKVRTKRIFKILSYPLVFIFTITAIFASHAIIYEQNIGSWISKIPIIGQIKNLVESADRQLKGEENGRINILLLGVGGKNHDGGSLTDTIILASLNTQEKKVALISIPRDLLVPIEGIGSRKINHVNAFAEKDSPGSGGLATSQAISDILNIPVDYYLRMDFAGFINIIDKLGGIEVSVDNAFNDYTYPIMGREDAEPYSSRFEHLSFEKGVQKMDGELALKYARSRHSLGVEGSDFARSRRQQKIMEAVKDQALSKHILYKPKLIGDIIEQLNEHVSTNLKVWELVKIWNVFKDIKKENITNKTLDNSPNGLLMDAVSPEGAYILTPRNGDFSEIQYLVGNIFSQAPTETKSNVVTEKTSVEVLNGTWVNGLANRVAVDLEKYGFDIIRVANYGKRNFPKSVIYDLTYGEKKDSLRILKDKTRSDIYFGLPEWLIKELSSELAGEKNAKQPDFILILGGSADTTSSGEENKY